MFATASDVSTVLQKTFSLAQSAAATRLIALVTGRIRGRLGQHISPPALVDYEFRNVHVRRLSLPHPPAIPLEVSQVDVDGAAIPSEDWKIDRAHRITRTDGNPWTGDVTVHYAHGFTNVPDQIVDVTVQLVISGMTNPDGAQTIRLEGVSKSWFDSNGSGLSETDLIESLGRYRWKGVG